MAGKLTQIKVVLSAEDKASAAIQNVGNGVRQLGDNSAGAARGFGAMQKGLGGFVGAYAGAAATFFALQQAYSALKESAKMEQSIEGTKLLASEIGDSGTKILESIKNITKGQLTLKDAAEATNLALSSGFNGDQIEKLTSIATKASMALGRDLGDSFIRLVRGSAKLEPELLDELGIFTRIEPAVQAYAISMGKSEKFLTSFERRQAFVNAVTEEGARKFSNISASGTSTAASMERLATTLYDLGQKVTAVLATSFAPFADFLSGSLANSFSAIGIVGGLAFTKLFQLISEGLTNTTKKLTDFNDSLQASLKKYTNVKPEIAKSLQEAAGNFDIKGKGAPAKAGEFIERLRKEGFKASDVTSLQTELLKAKAKSETDIRDILKRSGASAEPLLSKMSGFNDMSLKDTKQFLTDQNYGIGYSTAPRGGKAGSGNLSDKEVNALTKATSLAAPNAAMLDSINKYLEAQSKAAKGTESLIKGMQNFGISAVNAFSFITSAISKTLFWVSIIQLGISLFSQIFGGSSAFDVFYKKIGDMTLAFFGMTQSAQEMKKAVSSLANITVGEQFKKRNLDPTTKFGFMEKTLGINYETTKDQSDISKEVDAATQKAIQSTKDKPMTGVRTATRLLVPLGGLGIMANKVLTDFDLLPKVKAETGAFGKSIDESIDSLKKLRPVSFEAAEALNAQIDALKGVKERGDDVLEIMAQLSIATGTTAQSLKDAGMLEKDVFKVNQEKTKTTFKYSKDLSVDIATTDELKRLKDEERERTANIPVGAARTISAPKWRSILFGTKDRIEQDKMKPDDATRLANENIGIVDKIDNASKLNASLTTTLKGTENYLKNQVVNADALSKYEVSILGQYDKLIGLFDEIGNIEEKAKDSPLMDTYAKNLEDSKKIAAEQIKLIEETKSRISKTQGLLQLETQLAKTFQSEINLSQEFSGAVNAKGQLATQAYEVKANLLTNLSKGLEVASKQPKLSEEELDKLPAKERRKLLSEENVGDAGILRRINSTSINIIKGLRVSVAQELENLGNATIKSTTQSKLELVTSIINLTQQANADELQASEHKLQMLNAQYDIQNKIVASTIKLKELQESIAQIGISTNTASLNATKNNIMANQQLQPTNEFATNSSSINAIDSQIIAENKKSVESAQTLQQIKFVADAKDTADKLALLKIERSENEKNAKIRVENIELDKNLLLSKIDADFQIKEMEYDILDKRVQILVQEGEMLSKFARVIGESLAKDMATSELALLPEQQSEKTRSVLSNLKDSRYYETDPTKGPDDGAAIEQRYNKQLAALTKAYKDPFADELGTYGSKARGIMEDTNNVRARTQLSTENAKKLANLNAEAQIRKIMNDKNVSDIKSEAEAKLAMSALEEKAQEQRKIAAQYQLDAANKLNELTQINLDLVTKITSLRLEDSSAAFDVTKLESARVIQDSESNISRMQATLEHENAMRDIKAQTAQLEARAASAALQSQINRLNAVKEQLDLTMQIADQQDRIANAIRESSDLDKNNKIQLQSDIANDVGSNLFTDNQKRQLKIDLDVSKLESLQDSTNRAIAAAERNNEIKNQQLDIEKTIAKKQFDLVAVQAGAEGRRIQLEIEKITAQNAYLDEEKKEKARIFAQQQKMAEDEKNIQLQRIEAEKLSRDVELQGIESRAKIIEGEILNLAQVLDRFIDNFSTLLAANTAKLMLMFPETLPEQYQERPPSQEALQDAIRKDYTQNFSTSEIKAAVARTMGGIRSNIDTAKDLNTDITSKRVKSVDKDFDNRSKVIADEMAAYNLSNDRQKEKNASLLKNLELEQKIAGASVADAYQTYQETLKNIELKRTAGTLDKDASILELQNKEKSFRLEVERSNKLAELANNPFFKAANDFVGIVKDDMTKGLLDLNDALVSGTLTMSNFTEGLRDWAYSLVKDIQKSLVTRTIVEPMTNFIQKGLGDMFKDIFDIEKKNDPTIDPTTGMKKDIASTIDPATNSVKVSIVADATDKDKNKDKMPPGVKDSANPTGATGVGTFNGKVLSESEIKEQSNSLPGGWMPGFETLTPEERAMGTEATGTWAEQAGAIQTANEKAKESSSIFSGLGSKMGDWSIAIVGSLASVLAAGGDFSKALPGIFASLFGQILKDALSASSSAGGGAGGGAGGLLGGLFGKIGGLFGGGDGMASGAALDGLSSQASAFVSVGAAGISSGGQVQKFNSGGEVQKHNPIASMFGLASGGISGRDNVPTMLEPGEFVIRKSAAQALGINTLSQINNHGDKASVLNNKNTTSTNKAVNNTTNVVNNTITSTSNAVEKMVKIVNNAANSTKNVTKSIGDTVKNVTDYSKNISKKAISNSVSNVKKAVTNDNSVSNVKKAASTVKKDIFNAVTNDNSVSNVKKAASTVKKDTSILQNTKNSVKKIEDYSKNLSNNTALSTISNKNSVFNASQNDNSIIGTTNSSLYNKKSKNKIATFADKMYNEDISSISNNALSNSSIVNNSQSDLISSNTNVPNWLDSNSPSTNNSPVMSMPAPAPVAGPATNATAPNVSVNVTNTGTQQEVQGKPNIRMNGQQMVIDIVTRDFANNGPIRQSMRGNTF